MKAWGVVCTAVLALIPALALYAQGDLSFATAAGAEILPATVVSGHPAEEGNPAVIPPELPNPGAVGAPASLPPTPEPAPATAPVEPVLQTPGAAAPGQASPADGSRTARLEDAVKQAMADFSGKYSVAVEDLASGERWILNPKQRYHPASTIKMVVSLYALEQYRAGKLSWQQRIAYTAEDYESSSGALESSEPGDTYTVEELVTRALRDSNNIAVNMLGRFLGWDNIRAWSKSIDAELYRRSDAMPEVTILSELGWWEHLNQLSRKDPQRAKLLLAPLADATYTGRIPEGLPQGVPYLHKYGSYGGNEHDSGIVFASHPYVLIMLTRGATTDEADAAIARVSAAVYGVMK